MTIAEQAEYLFALLQRTRMRDGSTAGETWLRLSDQDVAALRKLAERLDRIAPHEQAIRRLVANAR